MAWRPLTTPDDAPQVPGAWRDRLYHGDNLEVLHHLLAEVAGTVHLVYLDPPFGTGTRRPVLARDGGDAVLGGFDDAWNGLDAYLAWIRPRLEAVRDLLHPEGSLLLHCDHHAAPYLAVLCDGLFGRGDRGRGHRAPGFRNEIVWLYGLGGSSPTCYPKKHDTILWYTRSGAWFFDPPRVPARSQRMAGMDKKCPDYWDIPSLNNMATERTGYPTQKPLALLDRIVRAHSRPGDLVADLCCGSGTTLVAAQRAGRRWIGCDRWEEAIRFTEARLAAEPGPRGWDRWVGDSL